MESQGYVAKYTEQDSGKPIECTESHQYCRSEMVPGITNQVSNNKLMITSTIAVKFLR